jgi:hypothetical protein
MDSEPLTNESLADLLEGIFCTEIKSGVFRIPLDDGSFAHLTSTSFVVGNNNRYPDLEAGSASFIGSLPDWTEKFTGMMVTKTKAQFYFGVSEFLHLNIRGNDGDSSFEAESSSS